MSKYYHEEAHKIVDKNNDTQTKRIISMQGNQNAKKEIEAISFEKKEIKPFDPQACTIVRPKRNNQYSDSWD